jgi:hypothetical protein
MDRLTAAFPELSAEVVSSLERMGHPDLAQQFQQSRIHRVTFDNSAEAAYIYLCEPDSSHGMSIPLEGARWFLVVDTTADDRPHGIEWLSPPGDVKHELRRRATA